MAARHPMPGVYFEPVLQPPADVLPRMDIAAFVGFAASGPLHTPVPIEGIDRFQDVFGGDVPLCRNEEAGAMQYSYLGSAVKVFFNSGGRRCWIVRVADEATASTATFEQPGVICIGENGFEPAKISARSPGTWGQAYRIGTVQQVTRLRPDETAARNNGPTVPFTVDSCGWSADVTMPPEQLAPGDLVQVVLKEKSGQSSSAGPQVFFGFIDDIRPQKTGTRLQGKKGFWKLSETSVIAPMQGPTPGETDRMCLYPLSQTDGIGRSILWPDDDSLYESLQISQINLVRFDILAWKNGSLSHRIADLGFHPAHDRFWGHLPADSALFSLPAGNIVKRISSGTASLLAQADSPRFPFCAPKDADKFFYLPDGMSLLPGFDQSRGADGQKTYSKAKCDGLETFSSDLFLDPKLYWIKADGLRQEAEHRSYLADGVITFHGIHSLLPIEEVTLVCVPDAVHNRWDTEPPKEPPSLEAPVLQSLGRGETQTRYVLRWSKVSNADRYIVEISADPDFQSPDRREVAHDTPAPAGSLAGTALEPKSFLAFSIRPPCPASYYFRVRAARRGKVSLWSGELAVNLPEQTFTQCNALSPALLRLFLNAPIFDAGKGKMRLTWESAAEVSDLPAFVDGFELQTAYDTEFFTGKIFDKKQKTHHLFDGTPGTRCYFRVRAKKGDTIGPWSNIIRYVSDTLGEMRLKPVSKFSHQDILAIHRGLIRLCAARGDLLAVLSMPRHFRQEEISRYLAELIPAGHDSEKDKPENGPSVLSVPPLTLGEDWALSHGALYHPWPAVRSWSGENPDETGDFRFIPPDGPLLGEIARKTTADSAWHAPANDPLPDVVALAPDIRYEEWIRLMENQVNVVRSMPRGFLLLNADTLSRTKALRPIHVRRLLILLRRLALREGNTYVFENNSADFRDGAQQHFRRLLSDLHIRGAFAGTDPDNAFQVVTDSTVNTPQNLDQGRFIVEIRIAPSDPLEFITVRLIQSGTDRLKVREE